MTTETLKPLTSPRNPMTGRFVPSDHAAAVQMVSLPGGKVGWRVGNGAIFADRAPALRLALRRAAKVELFNAALAEMCELSYETNWN